MDPVILSRLQFALTTIYHWLFVPLTLGLGWFVAFMQTRDEILVMDEGRIVERGTHHELWIQAGLYRRLWDLQNQILEKVER